MTDEQLAEFRSRINPIYAATLGTESYERRILVEEIEKLTAERDVLIAENERLTAEAVIDKTKLRRLVVQVFGEDWLIVHRSKIEATAERDALRTKLDSGTLCEKELTAWVYPNGALRGEGNETVARPLYRKLEDV